MSPLRAAVAGYRDAVSRFSEASRRLLLATFLTWMSHGMTQVVYNLHLKEAGFQEAFVGRVVAAIGLGMGLAALPSGWLADTWGRRRVLVLGGVLDGVSQIARALTLDPTWILVSTLIYGVAGACLVIPSAPFLSEHSGHEERTHLFSSWFACTLLAGVAGNVLGGQLPWLLARWGWGWTPAYRVALLVAALIAFAAAIPLATHRGLREVRHAEHLTHEERRAQRHLVPIGLNSFLIGAGAGLVIPFFNLYFATRFGCSSAQIGWFFSAAQMSTAAAALLGPVIAARFGKLRTAVASELLSLPFLVTLGAEKHLSVAVGAFWARATLMQASSPLQNAFVMETLPPALRARASSINNTVWNVGWAVSASVSGLLIERFGYAVPYYITAALYGLAATTFYLSFRKVGENRAAPGLSESAGRRGEDLMAE